MRGSCLSAPAPPRSRSKSPQRSRTMRDLEMEASFPRQRSKSLRSHVPQHGQQQDTSFSDVASPRRARSCRQQLPSKRSSQKLIPVSLSPSPQPQPQPQPEYDHGTIAFFFGICCLTYVAQPHLLKQSKTRSAWQRPHGKVPIRSHVFLTCTHVGCRRPCADGHQGQQAAATSASDLSTSFSLGQTWCP